MLINITGIDGSGKSTQIQHLEDHLRQKGRDVLISKAFGANEKEIFSPFIERWSQASILFLFQALHTEQRIRAEQALREKMIVLADRWDDSYFAYHRQYGILADDPELRNRLNEIAFNGLRPNITILLKAPIRTCMERCTLRGAGFFDKKSEQYHSSLAEMMEVMAKEQGWIVIDSNRPRLVVHEEIVSAVSSIIGC